MPPLTGDPKDYDISELNEKGMTGSCLCGSITVTLTQKDLFAKPNGHICHCHNCRTFSGSPPNIIRLPASNVKLSDPGKVLKTYVDTNTGSGGPVPRGFCTNCGSGIGFIPEEGSGFPAFVWLGLFPRAPVPEIELFTAHRQVWAKAVEGAVQHEFLGDFMG
jgi:hypothetical protein